MGYKHYKYGNVINTSPSRAENVKYDDNESVKQKIDEINDTLDEDYIELACFTANNQLVNVDFTKYKTLVIVRTNSGADIINTEVLPVCFMIKARPSSIWLRTTWGGSENCTTIRFNYENKTIESTSWTDLTYKEYVYGMR